MDLHTTAFYAAITFLVLGAIIGIVGVWVPDFYESDVGRKCIVTDGILFVTAVAAAIITKWLI